MEFRTLAQQVATLFAGTVLLENYNKEDYYKDVSRCVVGEVLEDMGQPFQVYAVELRTAYEWNRAEYEAAGVFYSSAVGCFMWPLLSCETSWDIAKPQNIYI